MYDQPIEKSTTKEHKFNLIDQFITNNPKIKPVEKNTPSRNLAKEHKVTPDELMTETLASRLVACHKKSQNYTSFILGKQSGHLSSF